MSELKIKQYVLDCINLAAYDESAETAQEAAQKVVQFIMEEADFPFNRQLLKTDAAIIASHISGLPSYFDVHCHYHDIYKLGVEWGMLSPNFTEAQGTRFANNWFNLLANNLLQVSRGYHVKLLKWEC